MLTRVEAALFRGDEGEGFGRADQKGRAVAHTKKAIGLVAIYDYETVGSVQLRYGDADAFQRVLCLLIAMGEMVGDDFGVGFR